MYDWSGPEVFVRALDFIDKWYDGKNILINCDLGQSRSPTIALLYLAKREAELETIITDENLRPDETRVFVETAFRDGQIRTSGTAITKVLPPVSRFAADGGHSEKKQRVIQKLGVFFERFFALSSGGGER